MLSNEKMTYILQDERVQDFYIKKILESFSSAHTPIFFKNIIEEWMENTKPLLKASTYIKYRNMLYSYIFPYFEDLTTEELTVECLNSFVENCCAMVEKTSRDCLQKQFQTCYHFFAVSSDMPVRREFHSHVPEKKS